MIQFNNLSQETPYQIFKERYCKALDNDQKNIEAISISSFNTKLNEVNSRYVNLKFITNDEFIFFSNYDSPNLFLTIGLKDAMNPVFPVKLIDIAFI